MRVNRKSAFKPASPLGHFARTIALSLTCAVAACSTGPQDAPANFDQRMRASVETVRIPLNLPGEPDALLATSDETYMLLDRFLAQTEAGYADTFFLDLGADVPATRVAAITAALQQRGLRYVGTATFGRQPASQDMILYLERSVVLPPDCGQWPDERNASRNNVSGFHGCSMVRNLALMVADPRDLLAGIEGRSDTPTATGAIVRLRTGAGQAGGDAANPAASAVEALTGSGN